MTALWSLLRAGDRPPIRSRRARRLHRPWFTFTSIVALCVCSLTTRAVAGPPVIMRPPPDHVVPVASGGVDSFYIQGGAASGVMANRTQTIASYGGTYSVEPSFNRAGGRIGYAQNDSAYWAVEMGRADGAPLSVGTYEGANSIDPGAPFLMVYGSGGVCTAPEGRFEVKQIEYGGGGEVTALWATFEFRCQDFIGWTVGEYRFHATQTLEFAGPRIVSAGAGHPVAFDLFARDASNHPAVLGATGLPPGATFTDLGFGHGHFSWTPTSGQVGDYVVTVNGDNGSGVTASVRVRLKIFNPPQILGFTPSSGSPGQTVYIFCLHLESGVTDVRFNGVSTFQSIFVDQDLIGALVPQGATTGPIQVVTNAGTATSFPFQVILPPVVNDFRPRQGPIGTIVSIKGDHFNQGVTHVSFGGVGTTFLTLSDDELIALASASGEVTVTTHDGSASAPYDYVVGPLLDPIVVDDFEPHSGPEGTMVRVRGHFSPYETQVFLGSTPVTFYGGNFLTFFGENLIVFSVPTGAHSGNIRISNATNEVVTADSFAVVPRVLGDADLEPVAVRQAITAPASAAASGSAHVTQTGDFVLYLLMEFQVSGLPPFHPYLGYVRQGTCAAPGDIVLSAAYLETDGDGNGHGFGYPVMLNYQLTPLDGPCVFTVEDQVTGEIVMCGTFVGGARPDLVSASPMQGLPLTTVDLYGAHMGRTSRVTFMGRSATFSILDDSHLQATVPNPVEQGPLTIDSPWGVVRSPFNFSPPPPPAVLTVLVEGQGHVIKQPDLPTYEFNTEVLLTAVPDPGWDFDKWRIGFYPAFDNPLPLVVGGDLTVTAEFGVHVDLDVKPSDLHLGSKAKWLTAILKTSGPYLASQIDVSSLRFDDIVPISTEKAPKLEDHGKKLKVWFLRAEVEPYLPVGNKVPVSVTGQLAGNDIVARDTIKVKTKGKAIHHPAPNEQLMRGSVAHVTWDIPDGTAGQPVALLSSLDDGATWKVEATAIPNNGDRIWTVPNTLTAHARVALVFTYSTDEDGALPESESQVSESFPIVEHVTGVGDEPARFALGPSSLLMGSQEIRYSLAGAGRATLDVYDLNGRAVRSYDITSSGPGWHGLPLGVASGIYFVRLREAEQVANARITVIR